MKYFLLTVILIAKSNLIIYSQVNLNPYISIIEPGINNYVYTYYGNIILGDSIEIKNVNDSLSLLIDSIAIDLSLVKFINYNNMFWANTNHFKDPSKNQFIKRTHKGNISLYTDVKLVRENSYSGIYLSSGQLWGDNTYKNYNLETEYYTKGFGDLKLCNYKNLFKDLIDDSQSMNLLYKSRNYRNSSFILYVASITSVIYGLNNAQNNRKMNIGQHQIKYVTVILPIGIGIGSFWVGKKSSDKSSKLKLDAIRAY